MNIMTAVVVKHVQVLVGTTAHKLKVLVAIQLLLQRLLVLLACTRLLVNQVFFAIVKIYVFIIKNGLKPELFIQRHALQCHA
jgi:hypothetical protein